MDAPEILTVIDSIPHLTQYLNALYGCRYADFFAVSVVGCSSAHLFRGGMLPGKCRTLMSVSLGCSLGLSVLPGWAGGRTPTLHQDLLCIDGSARRTLFLWCLLGNGVACLRLAPASPLKPSSACESVNCSHLQLMA